MSTERLTESVADYVAKKMGSKPVDNIVGEPTIVTYNHLEYQLAIAASAVKTTQWGGKHGHLALVVRDSKYKTITGKQTLNTDKEEQPAHIDPTIDGNTSAYQRLKLTKAWDEKVRMYDLQEEVNDTLKEMIINAVDAQYCTFGFNR